MKVPYVDLAAQHRGIRDELVAALDRVLEHGQLVLGPEVASLEATLAERIGARAVVTCNSGTDALVLALALRGIGLGDRVLTVTHSFVGTANAIRLVGAEPVFVDIDEETMNMDIAKACEAIDEDTRAVIPVHLNGFPSDLTALQRACDPRQIAVIEDCAQAFGATRDHVHVGAGGLGCFSLHPLKALSALGDGGFVAVDSPEDAANLAQLRNHGLFDRDHCEIPGYNSRLDALQAAFLMVKLERFAAWLERRRAHAHAYTEALAGCVRVPPEHDNAEPTFSAYVIRHPQRDALIEQLRDKGVDAKIHYPLGIHQQAAYADTPTSLPVTERVVGEIISLPISAK